MESMCELGGARGDIAVLELQREVAPDVRVLLVLESLQKVHCCLRWEMDSMKLRLKSMVCGFSGKHT
jgi:hypothetical protein